MVPNSSWASKAAAIAILFALLLSLGFIAVAPLSGAAGLRERTGASSALLAGLKTAAGKAQAARARGAGASSASRHKAALLKAATTGLAAAQLQKLLIGLARQTGGRPSFVQVHGAQPDGALLRISVNFSMVTGTTGLRDFLYELETHSPLLFVDELTLRRPGGGAGRAGRPRRPELQVTMQVSAYMRKEPRS